MVALAATLLAMHTQNSLRDAAIARADAAIRAAAPVAAADPDRPRYHFRAPAQWMNDPNGPILYKGWYHLFYQSNPFGAESGPKYWGHARSRDLVRWEDLPTALWPSETQGEREVWSGSVFLGPEGKPVAFYTSVGAREPEQWIATPEDDDLIRWRKDPVRITQAVNGKAALAEWRDPFLFDDFGLSFMVTGGGRDGRGIVALYRATNPNLRDWQYLGDCLTDPDPGVRNVECPNLFQVDGRWVLLGSVWPRIQAFVGELRNTRFVVSQRSVLGEGSYASQIFQGTKDRIVQIAWVDTQVHPAWTGYLTLPSEIHVAKDGTLLRTPVKELAKLRGKGTRVGDVSMTGDVPLPAIAGDALEMELTLDPGTATRVGVRLGGFEVAYEPASRTLSAGGHTATLAPSAVAKGVRLRLFLDRIALDVYAADGAATLVAHRDHVVPDARTALFAEGGAARGRNVVAWNLAL